MKAMYIYEVLPINVTSKLELLTYYSLKEYGIGDLIMISIRSRKVKAIICNVENIFNTKQDIKRQDFKYRKIENLIEANYIARDFLIQLQSIVTKYGLSINEFFNDYFPINFLEQLKFNSKKNINNTSSKVHIYPTGIEASLAFAKSASHNKVLYHSNLSSKKKESCIELCKNNSNIDLYTTPNFIFLLIQDLEKVRFYNCGSKYYKSALKGVNSFRLINDLTHVLCIESEIDETHLIDIDYFYSLNIDVQKRFLDSQKLLLANIHTQILDMKKSDKVYIHEKLIKRLINAIDLNKKVLIYTLRKGVATSAMCGDCGTVPSCTKCKNPYVLKEYLKDGNTVRYFICLKCRVKLELNKIYKCEHCESWRINILGIGTDGIIKYLHEELKIIDIKIFSLDGDEVKSQSSAIKVWTNWQKDGGILIATDMCLPFLASNENCIDFLIVSSMDSLYSFNEYSIDENIAQFINLAKYSIVKNGELYIQTRLKNPSLELMIQNDLNEWMFKELENRSINLLPPFYTLITFDFKENNFAFKPLIDFKCDKLRIGTNFRYIYYIPTEFWEKDLNLRNIVISNLKDMNLKINPRSIFR